MNTEVLRYVRTVLGQAGQRAALEAIDLVTSDDGLVYEVTLSRLQEVDQVSRRRKGPLREIIRSATKYLLEGRIGDLKVSVAVVIDVGEKMPRVFVHLPTHLANMDMPRRTH